MEKRSVQDRCLFVVYPSQRGGWSAQCVTDHKTKKSKLPFRGLGRAPREVIEQKSGIPGISFCHASRFTHHHGDKRPPLRPAVRC
ncbi:MAG: MYG1 family protein [Faecalibacterium prausnitzii]